jgi:DNA gyrase inhibitor GyrI
MKITKEILPAYNLYFVRRTGAYGGLNQRPMEKIKAWAKDHQLWNDSSIFLGIPRDNPETTPPQDCRYDACVVSDSKHPVSSSVQNTSISEGLYLILEIDHTPDALEEAWSNFMTILLKHKAIFDSRRLIIERYPAPLINKHRCQLCLPIKETQADL